jgi:hypothetical protein
MRVWLTLGGNRIVKAVFDRVTFSKLGSCQNSVIIWREKREKLARTANDISTPGGMVPITLLLLRRRDLRLVRLTTVEGNTPARMGKLRSLLLLLILRVLEVHRTTVRGTLRTSRDFLQILDCCK